MGFLRSKIVRAQPNLTENCTFFDWACPTLLIKINPNYRGSRISYMTKKGTHMFELTSSPTAYSQSLHFETVLGHCYEQSGSSDYQIAVKYGRKMEYLDDSGELTTSGAALAHFYLAEAMVMEMAA